MNDMPKFAAPAACATHPRPDLWFPDSGADGIAQAAQARAICRTCPALEACRAYAIPRADLHGLWAGLSANQRAAIRTGMPPVPRRGRDRCINGHRFSLENTQITDRGRRCRTCHNRRTQDSRERAS